MADEPRAYTPEEVRDRLLDHICLAIDCWDKQQPDKRGAMEGLAFSILTALDGATTHLPAFLVTPMAHPADTEYHKAEGENWYPEDRPDLGMLHEHFYAAVKRFKGEG